MAEYIDKQTVIDTLDGLCDIVCQYSKKQRAFMCGACNLGSAFDVLQEIPAADVRPTVKAHWTDHRTNEHDGEWYCSACGEEPWWCGVTEDILPKYCPNCGADMREES